MVYKRNRQSQAIIFNDSIISSCLQGKLKPTGPFQPKIAHSLESLLMKPLFLPQIPFKNHPNRWRTEGEHSMYEGEHPERRDPNLTVTNIVNMMEVAQFRYLPTSSIRIDLQTVIRERLDAP